VIKQRRLVLVVLNRRAGADQVTVAVNVVDTAHGWPEFVSAEVLGRVGVELAVGNLLLMEVNYTLAQIHTENKECRQCLLTTILPVPYPE